MAQHFLYLDTGIIKSGQGTGTGDSPQHVGLNLSGLTASLPIVTDGSKNLASVSYATFKSSLSIAQADVAGLTTLSSPAFAGLRVDTNTIYVDSTNHMLGIGKAPDCIFNVSLSGATPDMPGGASQTVGIFQNTNGSGLVARVSILSDASGISVLQLGTSADADIQAIVAYGSTNMLSFRTNNVSDRMIINSDGKVGIGTITPGSKLSIVGLPTSTSGLSAGDIWNNGGVLCIV